MKKTLLSVAIVAVLVSGCDALPTKKDAAPQTALQKLKSDNPSGLTFITPEEVKPLAKETAAAASSGLGIIGFGALETELNNLYSSFFATMNVEMPYQPKVVISGASTQQYQLMANGDIVIDYGLLKGFAKQEQVAAVLANSAALVASGHRQTQQTKKVMAFSSQMLGLKSQANNDTIGSLKEKAMGMALDELSEGLESGMLKDADRLAMELLASKGYDPQLLLDKLPGSIGNPVKPTENLAAGEVGTTSIDSAVSNLVKGLFSSAKEKAVGPAESRYDAAKLSLQKMPLLTPAVQPIASYNSIFASADTQKRFVLIDNLQKLLETKQMKTQDVAALRNVSTLEGLECATVTAHAKTLFAFNNKVEAARLTEQYANVCATKSQDFSGLAIAFLDKAGRKQEAYNMAVMADDTFDVPQFMVERIRLAKQTNKLDMSGMRCSLEWAMSSFNGVRVPEMCKSAEQGQPSQWLAQYMR
ncbi:MAG: hypothetical protein JHC38_03435 [Thiotrichales bacterium]|jgi:hypothetical protein|nr:hypothetical protein [Thiotrichales bacterium]